MPMISLDADVMAVARGAALFRGLADRTRLAILLQLRGGERRVVDLVEAVGVSQGTVSGHLACLRECGLITSRPQGRQSFYRLAVPELEQVLRSAEAVLAVTGDAVELCPTYGTRAEAADEQGRP